MSEYEPVVDSCSSFSSSSSCKRKKKKVGEKITFLSNHIGTEFRAVKTEGKKRKFFLSWVGRYFARYQSCLLAYFLLSRISLSQVKFPSLVLWSGIFGLEEGMDGSIPHGSDLKFWRRSSRDGMDPDPWR